jgi:CHAT domain-containing protein/tetratricopeptide (TPR) repeat protein
MWLKIALALCLLLASEGCTEKYTTQAPVPYQTYENVSMTKIGGWTQTDIFVPPGAMVAIMAEGECWTVRGSVKRSLDPTACLRIKIGQKGLVRNLSRLYGTEHVAVVKTGGKGPLYYTIAPFLKDKTNWEAKLSATVLVWDKGRSGHAESDIQDLILAHPDQKKFQALLFPLAGFFNSTGDYAKADKVLKRLRDTSDKETREAIVALILSAENEKWLRRYDKTKEYAEEALEISRREGRKGFEGEALLILSEAQWNLGQQSEAIRLAEEALQVSQKMKGRSNYLAGRSHQTLGIFYLSTNRLPEALEQCESAVESLRKSRSWRPLAQTYFFLGQAQRRSNMKEEAVHSYELSIKIARSIGRPETLWRAYSQLGRLADQQGDWQKAFQCYSEAISLIEEMRGELGDPGLKALFMENKFQVYEWMIALLHRLKRDEEAFNYLERAKARNMLDMLGDKAFSSRNVEMGDLLARERLVREQLQELMRASGPASLQESEKGEESDAGSGEANTEERQEIALLQAEHKSLLDRIEQLNSDLASLLKVNPLTTREVQSLLDDDTVLLAYYTGSEWAGVFLATKGKILGVDLAIRRRQLAAKVKEFRKETDEGVTVKLFTSREYEKPLTELYEILIKPVEKELIGKKHVVVVPHGMLHYLPFQALRTPEGKYLVESYTLSYLPSASVLKYAREKNRGNHKDLFAVANPATDLSPLPAAEVEAHEVSALFGKKEVLLGRAATKTKVKSDGPLYDLLLFSTHGEMIEADPLKSNLRFTPTQLDDGKLTVSEIFDMDVKANLVTLSACETGLARGTKGDFPQGDDLVGLTRAFMYAGAPSVVASLWKVSDDSTVDLMRSFYANLQTMPKAEALQQAQIALAKSGDMASSHPYFWAPFILVGDWK